MRQRIALLPILAGLFQSTFLFADHPVRISVPKDFEVQLVAAAPLVQHPMMGCFDDRGRLFLAESAGRNLNERQLDQLRPNSIRMLEDIDGDGVFEKSTVFADNLAIPNGALWLDDSLYVAEPPGIWRFTDTDDDGVADVRQHIAGNVKSNGMSSTLHGPVLHPSGRLFWCGGQLGYNLDLQGELPEGRIAPGIFSLLPDGTGHEVYAVGGRANPVEVAFGESGDIFGTIAILDFTDGARRDALMHWIYGGLYASRDNVPSVIHRTGPHLPPLSHVGQVAPAGINRYQSAEFGEEYRDNLFWAQFNTRSVVRTRLEPRGASYVATDEVFAACESVDFHPTDVIEDADGSLLIIDTGGWFRHGCPTSRIARPEALGAVYRVRRREAHQIDDARGLQIAWQQASADDLISRLSDPRPAVVEKAVSELAKREDTLPALNKAVTEAMAPSTRIHSVWSLSRQQTAASFDAIVRALEDPSWKVRQAAVNALGLAGHANAGESLVKVVGSDSSLAVRREAAAALGRIKTVDAVPPLIKTLDSSPDPFFQHAVIDALIRIGHSAPLVAALSSDSTAIRRGALVALSHLQTDAISPQRLAAMLIDEDRGLREAAFEIARDHAQLKPLVGNAVTTLLKNQKLFGDPDQQASIKKTLLNFQNAPSVQSAIASSAASKSTPLNTKLMLLEVMRLASAKEFPDIWIPAIESVMSDDQAKLHQAALNVIASRQIPEFDSMLVSAARNGQLPQIVRLTSLEALASRLDPVPQDLFEMTVDRLGPSHPSLHRTTAARILSTMPLSLVQLAEVADQLTRSDPLVIPILLNAFGRPKASSSGDLLIDALTRTTRLDAFPAEQLSGLIRRFPPEVQDKAGSILARLGVDLENQKRRLEQLSQLAIGGDVLRGKQVFFGEKASCSACHRVKGQGGLIGPNLSTIATIRTPQDLLESIVYPSSSIVQEYLPVVVMTTDGRILTGLEMRRSEQELWLKGSDLKEIRIPASDIEEVREASASIMPQGLDQKLSREELRDLMAFLLDLKPSPSYLLDE